LVSGQQRGRGGFRVRRAEQCVLVRKVPVSNSPGDTGSGGSLLHGGGAACGDQVLSGPDQRRACSLLLMDAPVGFIGD
jgi:hypothetical protein